MPQKRKPSTPSPAPASASAAKGLTKEGRPRKRREGAGRPTGTGYQPSLEQRQLVTVMAGMGIPEDQMVAAVLNPQTKAPISPVTLRKHFRDELNKGFVQATSKVGAALFKNATTATETYPGGIPTAQIFWLKCRARWQQHPERVPPPPAPPGVEHDPIDTVRRLAFLLEREKHAAEKRRQGATTKKKIAATS